MLMDEIRKYGAIYDKSCHEYFFTDCVSVIKIIQRKFMITEEIFPVVESQLREQSTILAVICSPLKHWPHPVLSSSSHLLQLLLSSYISHHKDESKRKLALQQDDSIHITNETVENCPNSICISRQFEYAGDPSKMRRRPTEQVAEHCQLQTANKSQVAIGRRQMRTRLEFHDRLNMNGKFSLGYEKNFFITMIALVFVILKDSLQ